MQYFGYTENDLAAGRVDRNLIDLLEFQFARTERYYEVARQSVAMLEAGQWGVMSSLEIYRAIITNIRRNAHNIFTKRAKANNWQKLRLVWGAYLQAR
jgi:phytoene synthase